MKKLFLGSLGISLVLQVWSCGDPGTGGSSTDMSVIPDMAMDVTPPVFAGVTSAAAALGQITLNWNAATDDNTPTANIVYQVYQATSPMGQSFATPTATTQPGATSYTVTGLAAATKYYFIVRARDAAGNIDKNTIEVTATTPVPDTTAPTFGGVTGATVAGNTITLSWTAATDNVSQAANIVYKIYQATTMGGENYTTANYTSPAGATSFAVKDLTPNTTYYFVVRAQDEAGNASTNTQEKSGMALTPTFSGQVGPLLSTNCAGCHSGGSPSGMLDLSSGKAYAAMVGVNSSGCVSVKRVAASSAANSYVVGKLNGTAVAGCFVGSKMPPGGGLSTAQIATVSAWINAGALNN